MVRVFGGFFGGFFGGKVEGFRLIFWFLGGFFGGWKKVEFSRKKGLFTA